MPIMGGFSSQTSAPFKPSSSFHPLFWSSRSYFACSRKMGLLRLRACIVQSDKNHIVNVTVVNSPVNRSQSSNYCNMPFDRNYIFKDARKLAYVSTWKSQEMGKHKHSTIPASSCNSESTSSKICFRNHADEWVKQSENVRMKKMEVRNSNDRTGVLGRDKQDERKNLRDRLDHDIFLTSDRDNIVIREPSEKLVFRGQTNHDQIYVPCPSKQQANLDIRTYDGKNEGKGIPMNGSSRASGKGIYSMSDFISTKTSDRVALYDPAEKISSACSRETAQPNGLLGNQLTEIIDTSPGQAENFNDSNIQKNLYINETYVVGVEQENLHLRERLNSIYDEVLVVDNISLAEKVVGLLTNEYRHLVHACDTEVAGIDVKQETPVDHGEIICFSVYSGPEAKFGNGKSCIWVDVLDGDKNLLAIFAPFFENPSIKKVWHNYSFDNHVIENYGIKLSGFHADTMHMARLWDSSRRSIGGYSLEALTSDRVIMSDAGLCSKERLIGKVSIKTIFGRKNMKKDGSEGKVTTIPPVEELQRVERKPWICYSALDSISTLKLYQSLKKKLSRKKWKLNDVTEGSMFDFYVKYWLPFGELLVKMETTGMLVDRGYLSEIEKVAKAEQQIASDRFRNWASKHCPDAKYMNVGSDTQLRQLFFGGITNSKTGDTLPERKDFKIPNVDKIIEEGKKVATKFRKISLHKIGEDMPTELFTASGWPSLSGEALKSLSGKVSAEYDFIDDDAFDCQPDESDEMPEIDLNEESLTTTSDISAYGTAYAAFGGGSKGIEACHAIASLCEVCSIDSLISNFILPLQGGHISGKNGRIHCSLNINTETGRLSARRPNLQNQPALEKDRYKIRQAFIAAPGKSLIVADYGQLELRILAHLANCKSMLDAFKAGGDFHSRTAMNMYPYIRDAVIQNAVLLEWDPQPGEDKPPVPLLKDAFASERRKAKMLNFSIAYGKTAMGLARDWKVSVKEAEETVNLWYSERKEVLLWQEIRKKEARTEGHVHTLLGRARRFPSVKTATYSQRGHIERAAINTPVQGSAADVAMCAMLEIEKNVRLKELGWQLLLQVHDEVILEGPTEYAEVAKAIVVDCMSKPFNGRNILKVDLAVDAKFAQSWYAAK